MAKFSASAIQHSPSNGDKVIPGVAREAVERTSPADAILQSWKEIASELNRSVRTVQRWERELRLPVRRVGKGSRGCVVAFRNELDRWLRVNSKALTPPRKGLLQDFTDFFRARQSDEENQSCGQCGSAMKFLKGHIWIYATNIEGSVSVPFCPVCDAEGLESFCRFQIVH